MTNEEKKPEILEGDWRKVKKSWSWQLMPDGKYKGIPDEDADYEIIEPKQLPPLTNKIDEP